MFRFENFWMEHEHFLDIVAHGWNIPVSQTDKAKSLSAKFKNLRRVLKAWQSQLSSLKTNIVNVKLILCLMDVLEEFRDLSIIEWNFRQLLKEKLASLLRQQQIYWKQRGTVKWVKFGDEGTKFFHANATIKHRRKLITSPVDDNGLELFDRTSKADLLWASYKERLGTTDNIFMQFDLGTLLQRSNELGCLSEPFSHEEIDDVVKNLPLDKSPGPDGFNTDFVKRCWTIIKQDFYDLCAAFHQGQISLQSINGSHKAAGPRKVSEYRPISLLNTSIKIITKLLANRLQRVILGLIHKNQYDFIKERTIQDCLACSFEYLHLCHKSRKEIIILKLDFEKAFDKIEHQAMLEIMRHKGFDETWMRWMTNIFTSGTSSILLNGVPGKTFHCRRGGETRRSLIPTSLCACCRSASNFIK
jgi:hypothetical protein